MPKTLAEIAIEAGLVTRTGAARAGKLSDERKQPLVAMLVRELGVDELALVGAIRKQTRVPLIDPAEIQVDPEALRLLPRETCARLRALPLGMATDGTTKVLRLALADPTDTAAVVEIEELTACELEICALPLSTIEELVDQGYKQFSTAVVRAPARTRLITSRSKIIGDLVENETSVTAQIPLVSLQQSAPGLGVEQRLEALERLLVEKGIFTTAELADMLQRVRGS